MYARGFFNAFQAYRKNHGGNKAINVQPQPQAKPAPAPVVPEPQLEVKPEPIQEAKPEPVQEVNPEPVQEAKPEVVPELKPEVVPEVKPDIKPEPQPVAQPVVSQPQPQPQPQKPVFKVQIFASSTLIKAGDARFKGLSGVGHYQEGGMYKYTVGDSSDYNAAIRLRKEIADKFPQAFIVAFKDGKRMDLNEAIGEFKKVKK
jgi:N-acetylmuramoyl-L-alanine amidase